MPQGQQITLDQVEQIINLATPSFLVSVKSELDTVRKDILAAMEKNRAEVNERFEKQETRMDQQDARIAAAEKSRSNSTSFVAGLTAAGGCITGIIDFAVRLIWKR